MAAAPEKLTPENTKIRKVDQNVEVSFDVTVDKLKPNYKVVISPVLYNGTNRQALDETVVTGKRRSLYETRNRETADKGTAIARKELPATIRYRAIVPYRDWMSSVSLAVGQTVTGCCSEETRPTGSSPLTSCSIMRSTRLSARYPWNTSSPSLKSTHSKIRSCTP